jgi:hypothetical protein
MNHGVRVLDFVPMMKEESDFDLTDLFVRRGKVGKYFKGTVADCQLGDDMLERPLSKARKIEFLEILSRLANRSDSQDIGLHTHIRESIDCLCADG